MKISGRRPCLLVPCLEDGGLATAADTAQTIVKYFNCTYMARIIVWRRHDVTMINKS